MTVSLLNTNFPDYFAFLGLPKAFDIDLAVLEENYLKLQHELHPDQYTLANAVEKIISLEYTTYLNEAFKTLKSSLYRALYLMTLIGIKIDEQGTSKPSQEILLEQLEFREALEESVQDGNIKRIKKLDELIEVERQRCESFFSKYYAISDFPSSINIVQKWLFLEKMNKEIKKHILKI